MDYGLAFTFLPNSSKNWIGKAAMGVVFALLIPVLGLGFVGLLGWAIAIARNVSQGQEDVLPEWSDIVPIFIDGFKAIALVILWYIPFWILIGLGALVDQPVVNFVTWCCSVIYGLPMGILLMGAFGMLAGGGSFGAALNPMNAWKVISANWANTIIVFLLAVIGFNLATLLGTVLCGIGILIGIPYGASLAGHLYGQLYRESQGNGKAAVA
jgi:hypothetical protein